MAKANPFSVRLEQETRAGMEHAARKDKRTLNSMIEVALSEWLEIKGITAEPPKPARGGRGRKLKAQALEAVA